MRKIENLYELTEQKSETDIKYFFISKGREDIIKAIQYSLVQELNGKNVYNLGFGDYDIENDIIIDSANTNNGDAYKVLNTVLSTIPKFFEIYSDDILMVQGSDGRPEFIVNFKLKCIKNCDEECKNFNRRINVYRKYVDKYYDQLILEYQFLGGKKNEKNQTIMEEYVCRKDYDAVFLLKRKLNFTE